MIATILWINWLALKRDRGAFLMTFVLPPLLFVAFAAIFSNTPGRDVKLKLAVADLAKTPTSQRLVAALAETPSLRVDSLDHGTEADVENAVRRGVVDTGLVIVGDPAIRATQVPLVVMEAPDRPLAASMALGQIQRVLGDALPDVFLTRILEDLKANGSIDADDKAFLDKAFAKRAEDGAATRFGFSKIGTTKVIAQTAGSGGRNGGVLQYAAGVSAIFLLFGAMQGTYGLIDERENGLRMILNFGHTVGHAIEAATGYKALLHGEAIGWGMVAAVRLAQMRSMLTSADAERIIALVHRYSDLPPFEASMAQLVSLTGSDKKKRSGTLSFVLPVAIGRVEIVRDVTGTELSEAVDAMLNEMRTRHAVNA